MYDITPNEYKLIETIRAMKPREELRLTKQADDHPKEYVVFVTSMTLFGRRLDNDV